MGACVKNTKAVVLTIVRILRIKELAVKESVPDTPSCASRKANLVRNSLWTGQ